MMTKTHHTLDNQPSARDDRFPIKPGKYLVGYLHLGHFCVLLGLQRKQNRCLDKNEAPVYYRHLGNGSAHYLEALQHFVCSPIHLYHIFINMLMCFKRFRGLENIRLSTNMFCFAYLVKKKSALLNTANYLMQDMAGRGFERQGTGLDASSHGVLINMFVEAALP